MTAPRHVNRRVERDRPHRVFISYSWDSEEHKRKVRCLADMLNDEPDIACMIDQYEPDPGHLPNWMAEQIEWANKLLLVFSPAYYSRFIGEAPAGTGQGVKWEGAIIQQRLYEGNFLYQRDCRAVIPEGANRTAHVPRMLRSFVCYSLPTGKDQEYRRLVDDFVRHEPEDSRPRGNGEVDLPAGARKAIDAARKHTDAGDHSSAIPVLEAALAALDPQGTEVAEVKLRCRLAHALYEAREDFAGAERHFREALERVPAEDLALRHDVLHGLGDMLLYSGRLDEADATIHAALDAARVTEKEGDLAASLISKSLLQRTLGQADLAAESLDEALRILLQRALSPSSEQRRKDNAHMLSVCYINKALLCRDRGDLEGALALYDRAEEQHRLSGDQLHEGRGLLLSGQVHCTNADWEKGFDCFRRALAHFGATKNLLWTGRVLENIGRLYATHERWEEALQAMLAAAATAEEGQLPADQVEYLRLSARLLRELKVKTARSNAARALHKFSEQAPEDQRDEITAHLSAQMGEVNSAIDEAVRADEQAHELSSQARAIAEREGLDRQLADCILDEARSLSSEEGSRRNLFHQAIDLTKKELRASQSPKTRGYLMGRLSSLYEEVGELAEAKAWLHRAGEVFEETGHVFGLANYYGSLAEIHRAEGKVEDESEAYRKVLALVKGTSFHELSAAARINLAATLRFQRDFDGALRLLEEAEAICNRHKFKGHLSAIARNRGQIETELQIAQAPTRPLPQLLDSLNQLLGYRSEYSVAYLAFWLFACKTELLALVRSGPDLSLMVVTDEVSDFLTFSARYRHLADYFLMSSSEEPTTPAEVSIFPIPPEWQFPASFPFLFLKKSEASAAREAYSEDGNDEPPEIRFVGPATMLPPYTMVEVKSASEGEGHIMALAAAKLPPAAVELMIENSTGDLAALRAVWIPSPRYASRDPFLTDLRIGFERGLIPVYLDRFPRSEAVAVCGGARVSIPEECFGPDRPSAASNWRRAILSLSKLPRDQVETALLALPDSLPEPGPNAVEIEVRVFEFFEIGRKVCYPALLART